jgi:hypothetical protein
MQTDRHEEANSYFLKRMRLNAGMLNTLMATELKKLPVACGKCRARKIVHNSGASFK